MPAGCLRAHHCGALLALPLGPVRVFAMPAPAAPGLPALRILVDVMTFRRTPDHREERTVAATTTLIGAGAPLGPPTAGLALHVLGVTGPPCWSRASGPP